MIELLVHGDVMLDQGLFEFMVCADGQEVNVYVCIHRACTGQVAYFAHAIWQLAATDYQGIQAISLFKDVVGDVH